MSSEPDLIKVQRVSVTFAEYLEKWLKLATAQGLNNPLVRMPVRRFRPLQEHEFNAIARGGSWILGTTSDPIARNLFKNFQTYIRERGEHCAFLCFGSVEMTIAAGVGQQPKTALFPVCLKRATLDASGEKIKVTVAEDEPWKFNPVLRAHLKSLGVHVPDALPEDPPTTTNWLRAQLGNRASRVTTDSYVGLFSSQQMVIQARLSEPHVRQALAKNPLIQTKLADTKLSAPAEEVTDEGIEDLGLVLPCDDSQLRVIQLSNLGFSLQVEGPPGTGKSQTIANIISNALYHRRNVLLVCAKKAAIVQVEERLANCGLRPALLNLHDEDLDKRDFLKQATDKMPPAAAHRVYPLDELRQLRRLLNDRVRFGRAMAHASLQVTNREALAGLLRLREELQHVPNVVIPGWQSISKERFHKLISSLGEWADLSPVLQDANNVWNRIRVDSFDGNPNIQNELQSLAQRVFQQIESLDRAREWAASLGIESPLNSDADVEYVLTLATTVLEKPICHTTLLANDGLKISELEHLQKLWDVREQLLAAHHPLPLTTPYPPEAEEEARELVERERVRTWQDIHDREAYYRRTRDALEAHQQKYRRLCSRLGLVYSPLLKVRLAQLKVVRALASVGATIPRAWWRPDTSPVAQVATWKANLQTCARLVQEAPFRIDLTAFDRIATTYWKHVESKAEHGFNLLSYCLHFVDDRKCKYALHQVFPTIPARRFKHWAEVTQHAVRAFHAVRSLQAAADFHPALKQLTSAYLAAASDGQNHLDNSLAPERIHPLENAAVLTEQLRDRTDLFDVHGDPWQMFWELPNATQLSEVESLLFELDSLTLPEGLRSDDLELALREVDEAASRIHHFLERYEAPGGDRTNAVLASFAAQQTYAACQSALERLKQYVELQAARQDQPNWPWLYKALAWRDQFTRLRGHQKLDINSPLWATLARYLQEHQAVMAESYKQLEALFENPTEGVNNYDALRARLTVIIQELPRAALWLEKRRWQQKIVAFPEIRELWERTTQGSVPADQGQCLFCFNLLRLCDPVPKPHGLELKQALKAFVEQDEKLAHWMLEHLKIRLSLLMRDASHKAARSESELLRLSRLQRIRGTIRELLNTHLEYLLAAKRCWMMSPISLAHLLDPQIFDRYGIPFDLVIFDEASQIRVPEGLLAMAFGRQVIIVGDKNQLPPTDFFASFVYPDAEDDAAEFGISESLLDEFSGVFEPNTTQVMLMSHYRSETPDLIQFSNDWFYEGKLEIYPPAHVSGVGRRLHYVPDGVYSKRPGERINRREAEEVIKLIEQHVRECPTKSLGLVTMNLPQMELIDELLQNHSSDAVRRFCADESKFFLRNLETVQGDEMDRIILSLTYGRNPSGQFHASVLGPITKSGGERRLNVAITRSRSGLYVVTSLRSADLETTSAQSRGVQCLKALLRDLESCEQARTFGLTSERFRKRADGVSNLVFCESPFEEQVAEFLDNEGYEIECQYGAGRFRIDIVVKERGRNLLAIECDGASYHSSLVARTRDRARQRVLEKLGWRVHRVWSTNWWFFPEQEKEALRAAIAAARQAVHIPRPQ